MPFSIRPIRSFPMVFASLITLLLLSNEPAYAEWVKLSGDDKDTSYADATTIRRTGNLVRMWDLVNFQTLQVSRNPYFSIKAVREHDCTLAQSRIIGLYAYADQMGSGTMVDSNIEDAGKWEPVMPGSVGEDLWKFACGTGEGAESATKSTRGNPYTDPFAIGVFIALGGLFVALLKKLNIKVKNLYVFTLTLWGIGFALAYPGYVLLENQNVIYVSYLLLAIGGMFMLASGSIFLFHLLSGPVQSPQTTSFKEPTIESSFSYRFGKRLGAWARRHR